MMREWHPMILLYVLVLITRCIGDCQYPKYLQTFGDAPSWFITYEDKNVKVKVYHNVMYLTECRMTGYNKGCIDFRRYCEVEYGHGRFLIKDFFTESNVNNNSYRCIQFLLRSASVVQVKISALLLPNSNSGCDNALMMLDYSPMISSEHPNEVQDCPLKGGYDFQLYLSDNSGPICDDVFLPLRVESDCVKQEGMSFYFRRRHCVDDLIGKEVHTDPVKLRCVGTWHSEHNAFSVVKWGGTPHHWCIRVSFKPNGDIDELIIYFTAICSNTRSHNRVAILRYFVRQFVQSICEDEVLICKYQDFCSTRRRDICKLTCSVCTPDMEQHCIFPHVSQGRWYSLQDSTRHAFIISNSTFTSNDFIGNGSARRNLHLSWQCVQSTENERSLHKRVLKLKFHNGCYPRYMCLDMELPAYSVMRYRTGSQLVWPIDSIAQVCEDRYFDYKPHFNDSTEINASNEIARTTVPWLYFVHNRPRYASCNLPWYVPNVSAFEMSDSSGNPGNTGCLVTNIGTPNYYLVYTYKNVQNIWKVHLTRRYKCLASIRAIGETDLIITQDEHDGSYKCWAFVEGKYRNFIYVYGAENCAYGTSIKMIISNPLQASAILVMSRNSSDCNFIEDARTGSTHRRPDDELSNLTADSGGSAKNKLHLIMLHILTIFIHRVSFSKIVIRH